MDYKTYRRLSMQDKRRVALERVRFDRRLVACVRCGVRCLPEEIEAHMSSPVRCPPGPDDQGKGASKGANTGAERIRS